MSKQRAAVAGLVVIAGAASLTACGVDSGAGDDDSKTITVMSHDSWGAPDELIEQFEEESGYTVKVQTAGDAGEVANKLILTADSPTADVIYGIDNTYGMRVVNANVIEPYVASTATDEAKELALPGAEDQLTAIDYGDVCLNVDDAWFAEHDIDPPTSLDDLIDPKYKDLFVTPAASTSSPGLAFLLATIAQYGEDGWQDYWTKLMDNGAKLTSGWSDAYSVDFSGGEGKGARPIVLSYASSPPFTIPEGESEPTTSAVLNTCFRQIEYAGVIAGTDNAEGAEAFIDFLADTPFQESIPDTMFMYPASGAALPELWAEHAPLATDPLSVDPKEIEANRDTWLKEWADVTAG
ncbi:thiamine ABC transporter substrate-binding protein [Cumulibacter soli]|uniref:thiamine ABC transporter substrate-binding protein n=1 Tax=Cumulibacter soli TaxID=2546344 RepID=UPI00106729EB|nr:thiamine ABC transporter substrate-binding protein [Cumulibacter soli]